MVDYEWFTTFGLAETPISIYCPANVEKELSDLP
jgi:hypothetical protein